MKTELALPLRNDECDLLDARGDAFATTDELYQAAEIVRMVNGYAGMRAALKGIETVLDKRLSVFGVTVTELECLTVAKDALEKGES